MHSEQAREGAEPARINRSPRPWATPITTALRLLLDYGIRKGALQDVQFKHFDHQRRRLTIFTKGQKVRELPILDPDSGKTWTTTSLTDTPSPATALRANQGSL